MQHTSSPPLSPPSVIQQLTESSRWHIGLRVCMRGYKYLDPDTGTNAPHIAEIVHRVPQLHLLHSSGRLVYTHGIHQCLGCLYHISQGSPPSRRQSN